MTNENDYIEESLERVTSALIIRRYEIEDTANFLYTLLGHTETMIAEMTDALDVDEAVKIPLSAERMTKAMLLLKMLTDAIDRDRLVINSCKRDLDLLRDWRKHEDKQND